MFGGMGRRRFLGFLATGTAASAATSVDRARAHGVQQRGAEVAWHAEIDGYYYDIAPASGDSFVVCGATEEVDGDFDGVLARVTTAGDVAWRREYSFDEPNGFNAVFRDGDGFAVLQFFSGDDRQLRLVGVESSGELRWRGPDLGGDRTDVAYDAVRTDDGGFALSGWTESYTTSQQHDAWLVKTDENGREQWAETYGTDQAFYANSLRQTADGGYVLCGGRWYDGEPRDALLVRTDDDGSQQWRRTFGGDETESFYAITGDGDGHLVAGLTRSVEGTENAATARRVDADGETDWSRRFTDGEASSLSTVYNPGEGVALFGGRTAPGADGEAALVALDGSGDVAWTQVFDDGTGFSCFAAGTPGKTAFVGDSDAGSATSWTGEIEHGGPDVSTLDQSSVSVRFENNFRTESTSDFLGSLYNEVQRGMPVSNPTVPDENEAYVHVDVRVEFEDEYAGAIGRVEPTFTHDQTDETFTASNIENFLGDVEYTDQRASLHQFEPTVFGWDNFRVRTPTQVGIELLEAGAAALSAGMSAGEVTSPVEARTEAYPDVYLETLRVEGADGETVDVQVHERLPRYDDVCTSVGFSGLTSQNCAPESLQSFGSSTMVMSPATVAVEDADGRITGRVRENGEYVTRREVPGAVYSGPIRHEFVLVPDGDYRVIVDGQERGTATIAVDQMGDGTVRTDTYVDVQVDEDVRLERTLDDSSLSLDRGRTGDADETLRPDVQTDRTAGDFLRQRTEGVDTETGGGDGSDSSASPTADSAPARDTQATTSDSDLPFGVSHEEAAFGGAVTAGMYYLFGRDSTDDEQ